MKMSVFESSFQPVFARLSRIPGFEKLKRQLQKMSLRSMALVYVILRQFCVVYFRPLFFQNRF